MYPFRVRLTLFKKQCLWRHSWRIKERCRKKCGNFTIAFLDRCKKTFCQRNPRWSALTLGAHLCARLRLSFVSTPRRFVRAFRRHRSCRKVRWSKALGAHSDEARTLLGQQHILPIQFNRKPKWTQEMPRKLIRRKA